VAPHNFADSSKQRKHCSPSAARTTRAGADKGDFGKVCVGDFRDEPVTLTNDGDCPLSVTGITSSSSKFLVPEVVVYPLVVAAGTSAEVQIRFQPTSVGPKTATLTTLASAGARACAGCCQAEGLGKPNV